MEGRDYSSLLTWARGELWAMEPSALEAMTAQLVTLARGQPVAPRATLAQGPQRRRGTRSESAVAVIPVVGVLSYRPGLFSSLFGGTALVDVIADVSAAAADPRVKAILMIFDSPGGGVSGVIETAAAIRASEILLNSFGRL